MQTSTSFFKILKFEVFLALTMFGLLFPYAAMAWFGTNGTVITTVGSSDPLACGVIVQSDGKLVVAGSSNDEFALLRFNPDGSLDAGFGSSGVATIPIGISNQATGVVLQTDGKLASAGYANDGTQNYFALARSAANGSMDTVFNATGTTMTAITGVINGLALQADGKLAVTGGWSDIGHGIIHYTLARFSGSGTLDSGFGTNGLVSVSFRANSLMVQSADSKLVVAGGMAYGALGNKYYYELERYLTNGSPDTGFGSGGAVTTAIGTSALIAAILQQPDGKLVAAGTSDGKFALARYASAGSLDAVFGTGGTTTTAVGSISGAYSLIMQPDNKLVVAGYSNSGTGGFNEFALVRYNSNGTLDASFGTGGEVVTPIGNGDASVYSLVLQADGKLVAAGYSTSGSNKVITLVRYNSDGSLDTQGWVPSPTITPVLSPTATPRPTSTLTPVPDSDKSLKIFHSQINPLHGEQAKIRWYQADTAPVNIVIYNMLGDKVATLAENRLFTPGQLQEITWNGKTSRGTVAGSGIYLVYLQTGDNKTWAKVAVVK